MGYSENDSHVYGMLFNENGKWKYDVCLDYTGVDYETWNLWEEARQALRRATEKGISGVTISELGTYWTLVVPEPVGRSAHPIMVTGDRAKERT